jgi:hypothetical protein
MPRSDILIVTWCSDSGTNVQKSQVIVGTAHPGARVAFDRVIEIGKAQRIAVEEDWRIIADQVPVAVLGIELERKAANVRLCGGGTPFASDHREAGNREGTRGRLWT